MQNGCFRYHFYKKNEKSGGASLFNPDVSVALSGRAWFQVLVGQSGSAMFRPSPCLYLRLFGLLLLAGRPLSIGQLWLRDPEAVARSREPCASTPGEKNRLQ